MLRLCAQMCAGVRRPGTEPAQHGARAQSSLHERTSARPALSTSQHKVVARRGEGTGRSTAAHPAEARCATPPLRPPVHAQRAAVSRFQRKRNSELRRSKIEGFAPRNHLPLVSTLKRKLKYTFKLTHTLETPLVYPLSSSHALLLFATLFSQW